MGCFFFSFFVEGYQMDPPQPRMICIILRIRNPDQNLDFPLDSNSFQFAKWKPQKKKLWRPKTPPTSNPSQPQSTPPQMVAQKMGCFHSKNSHQITSVGVFGARKVSANCTIRAQTFRFGRRPIPSLEPPGKKKGSNGGYADQICGFFPAP